MKSLLYNLLAFLSSIVLVGSQSSFRNVKLASSSSQTVIPLSPIIYTENTVVPFSQTEYIPCANGGLGEDVTLSGDMHNLSHVTITGNSATFKGTSNLQSISGTGSISGEKYQATGQTQFTGTTNYLNDGQWQGTFIVIYRIIGQKSGNNLLVRQVYHTTFNAQGILATQVENTSIECR